MVEVNVNATWRMSRLEFQTPYNVPHSVIGYGEVLLEEPATPSEGAAILRGPYQTFGEAEPSKKVYGTMVGASVTRPLNDVLEDTIEVDGKTIVFSTVVDSLKRFMEKWRAEDAAKPPVQFTPIGRAVPPPEPLTPMPPPPDNSKDPRANG